MGDLMTDTYTYLGLANKYGNFTTPSAKILIDGNDIASSLNVAITNIVITLSINSSGSVTFNIEGAYERKDRHFRPDVKEGFTLGKILVAEIGYLSDRIKVFKGFIASVVMDYNDNPIIKITAMDIRKLMMDEARRIKHHDKTNYADIVTDVMNRYQSMCSLNIDDISGSLTESIMQDESDYNFIQKIAGLTNREFFVIYDQAYFREPKKVTSALITLEYGLSLLSFHRQSNQLKFTIEAVSYDKSEQTPISETADAENEDEQSNVLSETQKIIIIQEDAETAEELKIRADSHARQMKDKAATAGGSIIGMPCLIPGRFIKLDKLDDSHNMNYYITEVRHTISDEGFITEFTA